MLATLVAVGLALTPQQRPTVPRDQVMRACASIEKYILDKRQQTGVPGLAIAVVHNGDVVYKKGFGRAKSTAPDLVDENTVFQLASMSKPISSTVIAKLVSDKVVNWDDKISDLDPAFQLFDPARTKTITIRDMYSHQSGMQGQAGNDLDDLGFSREDILRGIRYVPMRNKPYDYSNYGLTEGAVAAAKKANTTWEKLAADFFSQMGMKNTFAIYDPFSLLKNRSYLHVQWKGGWYPLVNRYPDAQSPAGGISSNVVDLAEWIKLQLANGKRGGRQFISAEALAETHRKISPPGPDAFYGLGWRVEERDCGPYLKQTKWSHAGAFAVGARTNVTLLPEQNLGIVVLTNAFPTGLPEAVVDTFFDYAFIGRSDKDWLTEWDAVFASFEKQAEDQIKKYSPPPNPQPALPLPAYEGTYTNEYFGRVEVKNNGGKLEMRIGPRGSFVMKHFDGDTFTYPGAPENPVVPYGVKFTKLSLLKVGGLEFLDMDVTGVAQLKKQ